jgi:hypothetical protein
MSDFNDDGTWEFCKRPAAQSFADNTTYYFWADGTSWSTNPTTNFMWFVPVRDMVLTGVSVYHEGAALPSAEPNIFSIEERIQFPNYVAYPTTNKKIIITKNFSWLLTVGTPTGFAQRFDGLYIQMVKGRLYALRMDVPAMLSNPVSEFLAIQLQGVYLSPNNNN